MYISQDGSHPTAIRQQSIQTYPTFNIAQFPNLMAKMQTDAASAIEIWNPRTKAWVMEDVDHSMNIKTLPELLIRFLGVTHCPGFENFIGEDANTLAPLPINKGKRRLDFNSDDDHSSTPSRRRANPIWQAPPTPFDPQLPLQASGSTSSVMSSIFPSLPSSPFLFDSDFPWDVDMSDGSPPTSGSDEPYVDSLVTDYDSLWAQGYVHVPEGKPWPEGMYARDMAWGLTEIRKDRRDVRARFSKIFPGVTWAKATYYRQVDALFGSTVKEIDQCRKLGRSPTGLWSNWRAHSSGWAKVVEGRKPKPSGSK